MRNRTMAAIALVLAVPPLAACKSAFDSALNSKATPSAQPEQASTDYGALQLAAGRQALDKKQYGLALAGFRNAQRFAEHAAAAHNGMAIAYAQIGRPDLAERFFKQAMSEAPGERRYQVNLENFYRNWPEIAVKTVRPATLPEAAPALAAVVPGAPVAAAEEPSSADAEDRIQQRIAAALQADAARPVRPAPAAMRQSDPESRILSVLRRAIAAAMPQPGLPPPALAQRSASAARPATVRTILPDPRPATVRVALPEARPATTRVALPNSRPATIRIELPVARTVRVSANEVRITAPQPQASDPRRRNPAMAAGRPSRSVAVGPSKTPKARRASGH